MTMAWELQDCYWTLKLGEKQKDFGCIMKENLKADEKLRKKAKEQLETQRVELEGASSWFSLSRHLQSVRRTPRWRSPGCKLGLTT